MQVSIIIPTYNRILSLRKAVDSVFAQSYRKFELLVVDDGSEDGTADMLKKDYPEIAYIRQENRGPAAARNTGVQNSKGELIAFLDSDDWFSENKLAIQVDAMQRNPSYTVSHTNEIWFRNGKILNQKLRHKKNSGNIFVQSLELCAVSMSTVMLRRDIFDRYGLFDEDLPCCEDYDFWLRISADEEFLLVDEPLTLKDGGRDDQVSAQYKTGMDRFRIKAIMKILNSGRLSDEQEKLARQELERKCRIYGNGCIKHGKEDEGQYYLNLAQTAGATGTNHE
jgi:glycosyltransferase involved in cell wall biosynthesis